MDRPNYITPTGYAALRAEYDQLFAKERPALVETIAWAAGNGDRSENGDYIYGRKRLREIDRRLGFLSKRMKAAKVVDPAQAPDRTRVYFGATVTCADHHGKEKTCRIVGIDEAGIEENKISWASPVTRALIKAFEGDVASLRTPDDDVDIEVIEIRYESAGG